MDQSGNALKKKFRARMIWASFDKMDFKISALVTLLSLQVKNKKEKLPQPVMKPGPNVRSSRQKMLTSEEKSCFLTIWTHTCSQVFFYTFLNIKMLFTYITEWDYTIYLLFIDYGESIKRCR